MMGGERLLSSYCATRDKENLFANGAHWFSFATIIEVCQVILTRIGDEPAGFIVGAIVWPVGAEGADREVDRPCTEAGGRQEDKFAVRPTCYLVAFYAVEFRPFPFATLIITVTCTPTMLFLYNQVFMDNHPPADKQISARFSDWKTQFLYVSVASKNLKNDRLSDIFFQKTRQNHSWKGRKKSKNRGFIAYSAIKQSSHTSLFPPIPKKISHKFRSLKNTPTHIHENLERLTLRGCKTAWSIKQG